MVGIIPNLSHAKQYQNGHLSVIFQTKTDTCPFWSIRFDVAALSARRRGDAPTYRPCDP